MAETENSINQPHYHSENADLQHLNRLCISGHIGRSNDWAVRPERLEYAELTQSPSPPNSRWVQALQQLQAAIYRRGTSVDEFVDQWVTRWGLNDRDLCTALRAVAAVLYGQAFEPESPRPPPELEASAITMTTPPVEIVHLTGLIHFLIENMLLIDYGLGTYLMGGPPMLPRWVCMRYLFPSVVEFCRQLVACADRCHRHRVPDKEVWDYIGWRLSCFRSYDTADLAIMLFHFHTRRRELSRAEYDKGMTGYTGVLQEIIAEVPSAGPDRLMRKLSVDVNRFSRFIRDPQQRRTMIMVAENIAAEHGIVIYSPALRSEAHPSDDAFVETDLQ